MGLLVRTVGLLRATAQITFANLAYNIRRLAWMDEARRPDGKDAQSPLRCARTGLSSMRTARSRSHHGRIHREPLPFTRLFEPSIRCRYW